MQRAMNKGILTVLLLIFSHQFIPEAKANLQANETQQRNKYKAKNFDPNRQDNVFKRKHLRFDVSKLKKLNKEDVPSSVPLENNIPVYELPTSSTASLIDLYMESLGITKREYLSASISDPIPGTEVIPSSLYVQYDPMANLGVRVTWEQGSGFYYGIRLQIDGTPVEEVPSIAYGDPEIIYFGKGAGFSISPAISGNYSFDLLVFDEQDNFVTELNAASISVSAENYFFEIEPYEPESIYTSDAITLDPDNIGNSGDEYLMTAQLVLNWDTYQGFNYQTDYLYPDVTYFELRSSYEASSFSNWENIGYVSAIPFDNLAYGDYTFELRACNPYGCSQATSIDVTVYEPPGSPNVSISYQPGQAGFIVNWLHTTGHTPTKYYIQENPNGTGWGNSVDVGTALSQTFTSKLPQTYYYRVKACNQAGCSVWSSSYAVSVKIPASQCPLAL